MLARVVCDKCKKDLNVKSVLKEILGVVIVVECCNDPECNKKAPEENPEYEKHLSDLVRIDPHKDSYLGIDI